MPAPGLFHYSLDWVDDQFGFRAGDIVAADVCDDVLGVGDFDQPLGVELEPQLMIGPVFLYFFLTDVAWKNAGADSSD
jgi:hypothetical protein